MSSAEQRLSALMRQSLAGDAGAYRTLLDELSRSLRAYFGRRLGRDRLSDAEDLVQEALIAIHSKRATYDVERPFTAWVHALARYKLIDYLRQRRLRDTVPIDDFGDIFAADSEDPSARLDLDSLLDTIPERQRTMIRQVKIEGLSIAEVAAASGASESAVKVSIHRGVKALAARLRGH